MFDQVYSYENKFYITGQEVLGVDSLDLSYSHSQKTVKAVGFGVGQTTVAGPTQQKVSLSRHLIYQDPLLNYTGIAINGSLNYNGSSYGFKVGLIEDYSVNCAVGAVPRISTNISIFDQMVQASNDASGAVAPPNIFIPNQGSISVVCGNSATNRVVGFDLAMKFTHTPVYVVNFKNAPQIATNPIVDYTANVQIDVDDAFLQNSFDFFNELEEKTITFIIKGRNGTTLQSWNIPKASLVGESLSSSADGGVKLTLNYVGHT